MMGGFWIGPNLHISPIKCPWTLFIRANGSVLQVPLHFPARDSPNGPMSILVSRALMSPLAGVTMICLAF